MRTHIHRKFTRTCPDAHLCIHIETHKCTYTHTQRHTHTCILWCPCLTCVQMHICGVCECVCDCVCECVCVCVCVCLCLNIFGELWLWMWMGGDTQRAYWSGVGVCE